MQLTEKTLSVLKNFASINPNVKFVGSEVVKTMSEGRNIVAKATIETFPDRLVCIYDLNQFIGTLGLVDKPEVKFSENDMTISDQSGRSRIKYFYADEANITSPSKDIVMPSSEVQFVLDDDTLNRLTRAASTLGHEYMTIEPVDGALRLSLQDISNPSSNSFSIDIAGQSDSESFKFIFRIDSLKVIPGDYEVSLSKKCIAHFKNKDEPIEYWVAMEKESVYN